MGDFIKGLGLRRSLLQEVEFRAPSMPCACRVVVFPVLQVKWRRAVPKIRLVVEIPSGLALGVCPSNTCRVNSSSQYFPFHATLYW